MSSLRDLELRHLIALHTVAEAGTFARAAEALGYTQSAISQQIAALERLVDGRVFDRPGGPRPVELTPLGQRLLAGAQDLLGRVDSLERDLARFRDGQVGRLTIGTFQSISATVLPRVVGRLRRDHPAVEIVVVESDVDEELEAGLDRGELDLSFLVGGRGKSFETVHLLDDPFVVVARPGQFPTGPVPVAALADEPLIGQHANSCQLLNEQYLRERGLDPEYVFRSNDNGTVTAMVRAGLGVAVLPLLCVEPDDPRTVLHPIDPPMPDRRVELAWRPGRSLAPVAERFAALATEAGAELLANRPALSGQRPAGPPAVPSPGAVGAAEVVSPG